MNPNLIRLTAPETGYVWAGYMIDEMSTWFLKIFTRQTAKPELQGLLTAALRLAESQNRVRLSLLTDDGYPQPKGFSEADTHEDRPPLFTERFFWAYLGSASRLGMLFHTQALSSAIREDVRVFAHTCLKGAAGLYEQTMKLSLEMGLYHRPPSLAVPEASEVIQKTSFLNGWFGDTRPMHGMELANLYRSLELLAVIQAMCTGFAQTAEEPNVRKLMARGMELANRHFVRVGGLLRAEHLPLPPTHEADITGTIHSPFSDALMLCHISGLFGSLITGYGLSLGSMMRHDLVTVLISLIGEAGKWSEDATELLIDREWLEKPPGTVDREALIGT